MVFTGSCQAIRVFVFFSHIFLVPGCSAPTIIFATSYLVILGTLNVRRVQISLTTRRLLSCRVYCLRSSFFIWYLSSLGSREFRPNDLFSPLCILCPRPRTFVEFGLAIPYNACPRIWLGHRVVVVRFPCIALFFSLLARKSSGHLVFATYSRIPSSNIDDSFQPSPAVCLRSGTPVMVIYTSLTTLAPVVDLMAAFSSWFRYLSVFSRFLACLARTPCPLCVRRFFLSQFMLCAASVLIRTRHNIAHNILGRSSLSRYFLLFCPLPPPPSHFLLRNVPYFLRTAS